VLRTGSVRTPTGGTNLTSSNYWRERGEGARGLLAGFFMCGICAVFASVTI